MKHIQKRRVLMILKKFMSTVFFIFLFLQSIAYANQEVVVFGDAAYPPYSYKENGKSKGIYVDIIKSAFEKIKDYNVTIKMHPWKRGLAFVKKGKSVGLFPPYFSKERSSWILFSEPILKEQVVVFGKAKSLKGKNRWPESFYGSKIGINRGFNPYTMGGKKFGDACKAGKIKLQEANTNKHSLKKLEYGRLDFYINDKLIDISKYPSIKRGIVATTNYGYLGFTKKMDNFKYIPDLKKKFDKAIRKMKKTNEIQKIVDTYMN